MLAAVVAGSLGLTVCDRIVDPPLPSDAEQFSPPAVYSTWWNMTQACSGLTGSLAAVTWYKASEPLTNPVTGEAVNGYWTSRSNRIVLVTTAIMNGGLVRHEMLHAMLQSGGHPRQQFLGKCGGTFICVRGCIRDAGPYSQPPEAPIHVRADSFEITLDVEPGNPTPAYDAGFFSITVLAHNPTTHWATVAPLSSGFDTTRTFSFDVLGLTGELSRDEMALDPSERIFAPGETKRHVFDLMIGDDAFGNQLPNGSYTVRGAYSDHWTDYSSFVIGP